MSSAYYVCCIYSKALKTNFIIEANNRNPDQSSRLWVHIACSICHQSKYAEESRTIIVVNSRIRVKIESNVLLINSVSISYILNSSLIGLKLYSELALFSSHLP